MTMYPKTLYRRSNPIFPYRLFITTLITCITLPELSTQSEFWLGRARTSKIRAPCLVVSRQRTSPNSRIIQGRER
ncbi:hypothetical protein K505DRAFT_131966 [Melanomma pulvis-pyrius CBS 109.77]|uniref:Uncharacterized protein n=1 Tax=Melanomma pulvis-pyrius CBS 109.77 TaxID=1314802 RepID=A0A6A6WT62_9PLEO|nr:hypothetical protein K505DRAFT_131966 [Melanomma pulvis-pyrius CBS 109.77]